VNVNKPLPSCSFALIVKKLDFEPIVSEIANRLAPFCTDISEIIKTSKDGILVFSAGNLSTGQSTFIAGV